jgi:pimeloyl-ACP methyl ester carboxylesterase
MTHFDKAGLPGRPAQPLALRLASMMMHREWSETKPVQLIERITCPLMLITCGQDRFVKAARLAELQAALARRQAAGRKATCWHLPDMRHLGARENCEQEYALRISEFLAGV